MYFVSLHHQIKLDENLAGIGFLDEPSINLIKNAAGVLMPKYFSPIRYQYIASIARTHFPNLAPRYNYRGKAKQVRLFRRFNIPHPRTIIFDTAIQARNILRTKQVPFDLPFVLKGDRGGGGSTVFPISSWEEFEYKIIELPLNEPILIQEWIENQGMDLRVVVIGQIIKSYFRLGGESFYNNVSKGARIDYNLCPGKQKEGIKMAYNLSKFLNIDLGAFDIMFPVNAPPLLIEINFLFGRIGLGGTKGFNELYIKAVRNWIEKVKNLYSKNHI